MSAYKFSAISKTLTIGLYEPVIDIINKKLEEFTRFAEENGHDIPQKKDLYNYIIVTHSEIDIKDFFKKIRGKKDDFFYTSTIINGISKSVLEKQLHILTEHAYDNFPKVPRPPRFKDIYNYLFAKLDMVTAEDFFNVKK